MASESRYNAMLKIGAEIQGHYERKTVIQQEANDRAAELKLEQEQDKAALAVLEKQHEQRSKDVKGRAASEQKEMLESSEKKRRDAAVESQRQHDAEIEALRLAEEEFAREMAKRKRDSEEKLSRLKKNIEERYAEEKKRADNWVVSADERQRKADEEFALERTKKQNAMSRRELEIASLEKNVNDRVTTIDKQIEIAREIMTSLKEISVAAPPSTQ